MRWIRAAIRPLVAVLVGVSAWLLCLDRTRALEVDIGPGARDYFQGLSPDWRLEGETFWRPIRTRARIALPLVVEGPGTLSLTLRSKGPSSSSVRAELDDVSLGSLSIAGADPVELRWEVPEGRRRAVVRLRAEPGSGSEVEIGRVRWVWRRAIPARSAIFSLACLILLTYLSLVLAGLAPVAVLLGTLAVALAMSGLSSWDAFAGLHLAPRLATAAAIGAVALLVARFLARNSSASLRALFLTALLFKSALVFHPRFYFVDLPIHETLLELVYHRGVVDFWSRLPEYQRIHNLGVASVAGEYRAFPYPVAFYFFADVGNELHHAPELWLKLIASLFAALALFPLGYLARTFDRRKGVEAFAAIAYLLVPSLTRSLLLLELSAILGCFFDLLALACLARLSLQLSGLARFSLATAAMTAALVAYTAGFIHFGLFVGSALVLGLLRRGVDRRNLARLAGAGLLAAVLALATYHPDTVLPLPGLFASALQEPTAPEGDALARADSVLDRVTGFLGLPLLGLGIFGLALAVPKLEPPPSRFLFASWALSAFVAVLFRFAFADMFRFAKELYWGAGVLSVGVGSLLAAQWLRSRYGRISVVLALAALALAFASSFRAMIEQFYTRYLFL